MAKKQHDSPEERGGQNAHDFKAEVRGVFSTQEVRKVGTGTTTRKTVQKTFWFLEQHGDVIDCQPLNTNYIPTGPKRKITMDELIAKFSPEPEFYMNSVYPKMQALQQNVDNADKHRENGENFAAEFEYSRALKLDADNVRANFGIGLTYLERGDAEKAQNIFERLVKLEGAFEPEHKFLFNEFGINLRKNKMFDHALVYYGRALEVAQEDENLHMNMARVMLETKNFAGCVEHLLKALDISPRHEVSLKFLVWLLQKNLVPADRVATVKERLHTAIRPGEGQSPAQAPKNPQNPSAAGKSAQAK
ncbi:MAG: tetratricopeptide repeat protein [Desulfovibrio sp.]|jgi:tetratricopeptide (TPR) repeat protein|nr:tetratricopeptide repeat protein [Desulfovibrio sp.]